jgi:hypothetical protein
VPALDLPGSGDDTAHRAHAAYPCVRATWPDRQPRNSIHCR